MQLPSCGVSRSWLRRPDAARTFTSSPSSLRSRSGVPLRVGWPRSRPFSLPRVALRAAQPADQSLLRHIGDQHPSWNRRAVDRPRPPEADGEIWSYSSHSSARNGRWNHIAWSRLGRLHVESDEDRRAARCSPSSRVRSRREGERSLMQPAVVRQRAVGPDPRLGPARDAADRPGCRPVRRVSDVADVERTPFALPRAGGRPDAFPKTSASVGSVSGGGDVGHRVQMLEAGLRDHGTTLDRLKIALPPWMRRPGGSRSSAVADAVDVVDDRRRRCRRAAGSTRAASAPPGYRDRARPRR